MKNKLMTHVVAGYPTKTDCIELLLGMQRVGVTTIEVQIPFSDPSADGPAIMEANDVALNNNMTVSECFEIIQIARRQGLKVPAYIMSYANKVSHFGFEAFCKAAKKSAIEGFIIPDLPPDTPEYKELLKYCDQYSLALVPVISPGISPERLTTYISVKPPLIYTTSTHGVTGRQLAIRPELVELIQSVRIQSTCQIALGFGIRTTQDVQNALEVADMGVVGSEAIRVIEKQGIVKAIEFIEGLVHDTSRGSNERRN